MTLGQNGTQSPVCRGRVQCITHPTTPWDPLYITPLEGPFSDHTFYLFLYQRTHYFILSSLQHLYSHFILVPVSSHGPEQAPPVMMGRGAPRRRHLLCCWRPNCSLWKCLTLYFVYFGCKFFFFSFFLSFFFPLLTFCGQQKVNFIVRRNIFLHCAFDNKHFQSWILDHLLHFGYHGRGLFKGSDSLNEIVVQVTSISMLLWSGKAQGSGDEWLQPLWMEPMKEQ